MGWFMQIMLNRLLPCLVPFPLPPGVPGTILLLVSDVLWYIALVSLLGLKRQPFPMTFPSQHSSEKPNNKDLLSFRWHVKDLNSHLDPSPLDMERKVIAGAKTAEYQCGILFPFLFSVNSLLSCIQCT
uniref:Uncharacterized protein n=1 Tax=Molossus molossus TaxID=27622 RepID=A0A7J8FZB7_MOLMO|nr:hypothetical protein HJG59_008272 [Molossus molossus]